MNIIDKQIQPTMSEVLLSLVPNEKCIEENSCKAGYIRSVISKIHKENSTIRFVTKTEKGKIYVWRKA